MFSQNSLSASHSKMHSDLNYRQSRRSACDRCRGFKLRCERDQINGRSCERCLKAQVVCTTNIGHPSQSFIASKSNDCNGRIYSDERLAMPVLRKSSSTKVRKSTPSPHPHNRRIHTQRFNTWPDSEPFPYLPSESLSCFQMNSYPNEMFAFDPWIVPEVPQLPDSYAFPQFEDVLFEPYPHLGSQVVGPESTLLNPQFQFAPQEKAHSDPSIGLQSAESLGQGDFGFSFPEDFKPNIPLESAGTSEDMADQISPFKFQKCLLKLDLELIDDLELLEMGSVPLKYSSLKQDLSSIIGKLDLPIHRVLNHSTHFLNLIQFEKGTFDKNFVSPSIRSLHQTSPTESTNETIEDRATVTSSIDSGYLPMNDVKTISSSKYDLATYLMVLSTYYHLISLHCAIFGELYQLFLMVLTTDIASSLVLPSLNFGNAHIDGGFPSQIQLLIDFSLNMVEKIEQFFGISTSQIPIGNMSPTAFLPSNVSLSSSRERILGREGLSCGTMLRETMHSLQQLLKESTDI